MNETAQATENTLASMFPAGPGACAAIDRRRAAQARTARARMSPALRAEYEAWRALPRPEPGEPGYRTWMRKAARFASGYRLFEDPA